MGSRAEEGQFARGEHATCKNTLPVRSCVCIGPFAFRMQTWSIASRRAASRWREEKVRWEKGGTRMLRASLIFRKFRPRPGDSISAKRQRGRGEGSLTLTFNPLEHRFGLYKAQRLLKHRLHRFMLFIYLLVNYIILTLFYHLYLTLILTSINS